MEFFTPLFIGAVASVGAIGGAIFIWLLLSLMYRTVVSTNDVHIVQSTKSTVSYGRGQSAGNTYYAWPAWWPYYGVKRINLPVSVVTIKLEDFPGYDKGRVPFVIDIMAFFMIDDPNTAAQRVHTFDELKEQLKGILQGASRSILAKAEIETILEERSLFGQRFTDAVREQLKAWGVSNVKNIELMDIRDASGSKAIANIMAKKQSLIDMESRREVAKNTQVAQEAEIAAKQIVAIRAQEADELIGRRTAEKDQNIGIAQQTAAQAVKEAEKETKTKEMNVIQVQEVRKAEIVRQVNVVGADQRRQTLVIDAEGKAQASIAEADGIKKTRIIQAEGEKQQTVLVAEGTKAKTVLVAEGDLSQAQLNAKGIEAQGVAKGVAEQAVLMAPVNSQIALAKEIGGNQGYQQYLVTIKTVEKDQAVGIAQAEALAEADIKVIANTGDPVGGVKSVMDLFSSKGGTNVAGMVEAIAQSPVGDAILKRIGNGGEGAH